LGFRFDRRWLIVDPTGKFITQRQVAGMVLIQPAIDEANKLLKLSAPGMDDINIPLTIEDRKAEVIEVAVWGDKMQASVYDDAKITEWLTKYMGQPARLVTVISTEEHKRPINKLVRVHITLRSAHLELTRDELIDLSNNSGILIKLIMLTMHSQMLHHSYLLLKHH
jgi:uncharacterized protein YcbX